MILNNKVLQKLEIIGFKESVKKSTSRIQVYTLIKKFVPKNIPSYNSESKFVHQQIFSLIDSESDLLIALLLLSSKVAPPNMVLRPNGSLELPSTLGIVCRKIAQKLDGFEGFHFHQLRHTYTSNLLANGAAPKDVQELLGHSDVSTTMNVYAHSTRKAKR